MKRSKAIQRENLHRFKTGETAMVHLQATVIHSERRGFRLLRDLTVGQRVALEYDRYNVHAQNLVEVWLHHVQDDPTARIYLGRLAETEAAAVIKALQRGRRVTAEVLRYAHQKSAIFPEITLLIEMTEGQATEP